MFECFPFEIGNKARMFVLITCIQDHNICSNQCNKARKKTGHADNKGRNKTLLSDDLIIYVEDSK